MKPSEGRIVMYNLTDADREKVGGNHSDGSGAFKQAPAIIVKVWGNEETSAVNLKVFGDAEKNLYVTSSVQGDQPGQWQQPPRV